METTIFQVKLNSGAVFNVFCNNKKEIQRFKTSILNKTNEIESITELLKGIHNLKDFENLINNES